MHERELGLLRGALGLRLTSSATWAVHRREATTRATRKTGATSCQLSEQQASQRYTLKRAKEAKPRWQLEGKDISIVSIQFIYNVIQHLVQAHISCQVILVFSIPLESGSDCRRELALKLASRDNQTNQESYLNMMNKTRFCQGVKQLMCARLRARIK